MSDHTGLGTIVQDCAHLEMILNAACSPIFGPAVPNGPCEDCGHDAAPFYSTVVGAAFLCLNVAACAQRISYVAHVKLYESWFRS